MRILNSKELAGLSQVYPEGFTGRVGLMILKAQHKQDLMDFIYLIEAGTADGKWLSDILDELKQLLED